MKISNWSTSSITSIRLMILRKVRIKEFPINLSINLCKTVHTFICMASFYSKKHSIFAVIFYCRRFFNRKHINRLIRIESNANKFFMSINNWRICRISSKYLKIFYINNSSLFIWCAYSNSN